MNGGLLDALAAMAAERPLSPALVGSDQVMGYRALADETGRLAEQLTSLGCRRLGLLVDNRPEWVALDLAAEMTGCVRVPLPGFFSDGQLVHAATDAGLDCLITDQPQRVAGLAADLRARPLPGIVGPGLWAFALPVGEEPALPRGTAKINYTSGTTGTPTGVCLGQSSMDTTAEVLARTVDLGEQDRHLCLLPLSLLLENLAGVQAMLLRGASVGLPSLAEVGMQGASWIDPEPLRRALEHYRPTILILVPQLLQALIWLVERGLRLPQLRFAAVGGALVSPRLLWRAVELGLPVYEGYGLSECASVVALNTPGDARVGSVGRLLPHLSLAFAQDGELQIAGNGFLGYLGQCPRRPEDAVSTGDIGRLDADGFLHLRGRKGHVFVTSFGRNVSPEWVERELMAEPEIAQVVVFGEAKPWGTALVSVDGRGADAVTAALERVNRRLPDYARVRAWVRSDEPFSFSNQELTANGRPRRAVIWARYGERIEQLYS